MLEYAQSTLFCVRPCFGIYRFHFAACHPHAISTVKLALYIDCMSQASYTLYDVFYTIEFSSRSSDFSKKRVTGKNAVNSIEITRSINKLDWNIINFKKTALKNSLCL